MKKILSVLCVVAMIASFACFSVSADETAPVVSFAIEVDPVAEGAETLTAKLLITLPENATGYELGAFGVEVSYDDSVMKLSEEPSWEGKGSCTNSENTSVIPYTFLWVSIKKSEQFKPGTNVASIMTFDLEAPAKLGDKYEIKLAIDATNGVASMADQEGKYPEVKYDETQAVATGIEYVVAAPVVEDTTTETTTTTTEATTTKAPEATTTKAPETTTTTAAATTTKAPDKATQTGDMAFVVVAVMVATLGAAVVVKKVSVR